jgi:hypothetical protein
MLRACALKYGKSWDKSLPYAEFSYTNSYQASIKMAPYEALYGRQCRTSLFWSQTRESQVFKLEVLKDAKNKSEWFAKVWRFLSLDRRAMRIKEEEISHLKSEISYTSKSHLWEVPQIQGQREVSPMICRTIRDYWPLGRSGLSTRATTTIVRSARYVSRITTEEVLTSARGATTYGISWPWRWFDLQWKANQDLGYRRMSDSQ